MIFKIKLKMMDKNFKFINQKQLIKKRHKNRKLVIK